MTLSTALSSALSGLTATSRRAEVVSTNIANADTPGYVRRDVQVSSRMIGNTGHGVQVDGVVRLADPVLTGDRRIAGAQAGGADVLADFAARMEAALGRPGQQGSLSDRIGTLEQTLIAAAGQPSAEARLAAVLSAAQGVAQGFARASADVQTARQAADTRIAAEVDALNTALRQVHELNVSITAQGMSGGDVAALQDRRQAAIDRIAELVPLREVPRDGGKVALFTTGGAILLDSFPVELGFDRSGVLTAERTALPGLTLGGQPVRNGPGGPMHGGVLGALFTARDTMGIAAQARLDSLAAEVTDRFAQLDQVAGAGLFTDRGAPASAATETGLAARLTVNAAADPQQGGALWRLRDGLGAVIPGPAGNGALLSAYAAALTDSRTPVSTAPVIIGSGQRSVASLATEFASQSASLRLQAEADASHATARGDALKKMELDHGVDTDAELQDLLVIERAYAANARVVKTVDDLIQILLGF